MVDDSTDRSPAVTFLRELGLTRNAKIGFAVSIAITIFVYIYRTAELIGPVPDTRGSPLLFALLAFVLAVSMGTLLTVILTVVAAIRRVRRLD